MELAVDGLAVCVEQFEGVRAIAVHVAVAVGNTAVAEQEGHLQEEETGKRNISSWKYEVNIKVSLYFSEVFIQSSIRRKTD